MKRLTQAIVRDYLRHVGGKFRKDTFGDYRVTLDGAEYFTQDLDDAICTARVMAGGHPRFEDAEAMLRAMGIEVNDRATWRD